MTLNSYLREISTACILRDRNKERINVSVASIQAKLTSHFGDSLIEQRVFGSYSRNTILPRRYDARSDVDLMVVFKSDEATPQTYLNRLRRFAEARYFQSQIKQSNPTIKLELNHITFELVPANSYYFRESYRIPAPSASWFNWIDTNVDAFERKITSYNRSNSNLTKPIVRILKRWNSHTGYPFASYELEKQIVENSVTSILTSYGDISAYFFSVVNRLNIDRGSATWKTAKLSRLKELTGLIKREISLGNEQRAELILRRLIPI